MRGIVENDAMDALLITCKRKMQGLRKWLLKLLCSEMVTCYCVSSTKSLLNNIASNSFDVFRKIFLLNSFKDKILKSYVQLHAEDMQT